MKTVSVFPADLGWAVRAEEIENPLIFRRGSQAEATAKRIALALAETGHTTEIKIQLRDGSIAARFVCPANDRPEPGASSSGER